MVTGSVDTVIANSRYYVTTTDEIAVHIRDIAGRNIFNDANKRMADIVVQKLAERNGIALVRVKVRRVIEAKVRGEIRTVEEIATGLRG